MIERIRASFTGHPFATAVFLSPVLVLIGTSVAEHFFCYLDYLLNPYLGLWHSIAWLAISCALVQLDRPFCQQVVGSDPPFGTQLFALIFVSVNANAVIGVLAMAAYLAVRIVIGSPC